jgi:hypothetical protein
MWDGGCRGATRYRKKVYLGRPGTHPTPILVTMELKSFYGREWERQTNGSIWDTCLARIIGFSGIDITWMDHFCDHHHGFLILRLISYYNN